MSTDKILLPPIGKLATLAHRLIQLDNGGAPACRCWCAVASVTSVKSVKKTRRGGMRGNRMLHLFALVAGGLAGRAAAWDAAERRRNGGER